MDLSLTIEQLIIIGAVLVGLYVLVNCIILPVIKCVTCCNNIRATPPPVPEVVPLARL